MLSFWIKGRRRVMAHLAILTLLCVVLGVQVFQLYHSMRKASKNKSFVFNSKALNLLLNLQGRTERDSIDEVVTDALRCWRWVVEQYELGDEILSKGITPEPSKLSSHLKLIFTKNNDNNYVDTFS